MDYYMKYTFILIILIGQCANLYGFPIEAEKPQDTISRSKPILYIALDPKDEFSQQLKMELTKDWYNEKPPERDINQTDKEYNKNVFAFWLLKTKMINLNKDIRNRVNLQIIEDVSDLPAKCPSFAFGKNSKWEIFPNEAFRDYALPLRTILYEIDLWYSYEWLEKLEEKRLRAGTRVNIVNDGINDTNLELIQRTYGSSGHIIQYVKATAIYRFNGKLWDKIAAPAEGHKFIPDDDVDTICEENNNYKLHVVRNYISHYIWRKDIYTSEEITIPTNNLNKWLMIDVFPKVNVLPNPPWEPEYSFVPF